MYDLATATAVYRNRISPDPIFLTAASPSTGGFYAINRCAPTRPQTCLRQLVLRGCHLRSGVLHGLMRCGQ